jgi:DNA-binding NtrC family response regulator
MPELHRILIVEDDPLVAEIIAAALGETYSTALAETAEAAMALLRCGEFRLMLLDCTLPGGIDAELIPQADRIGMAVILMSGDPERATSLTERPRPFLLKPFTLGSRVEAVETVLAPTTSRPN